MVDFDSDVILFVSKNLGYNREYVVNIKVIYNINIREYISIYAFVM